MQTYILNSLQWAEKEPSLDCDEAFIPSLPERVSFTAFQPVSGKFIFSDHDLNNHVCICICIYISFIQEDCTG